VVPMSIKDMIYVVAPHEDEGFTQIIAREIADKTGVLYADRPNIPFSNKVLILELGGILDRNPDVEIMISDKTKTKIFESVFSCWFQVAPTDFGTTLDNLHKTNYARLELTNRVRFNPVARKLVIKICVEIIELVKRLFDDEVVQ